MWVRKKTASKNGSLKDSKLGKKVPIMVINPETIVSQKPREDEVSRKMLSRESNPREGIINTQ